MAARGLARGLMRRVSQRGKERTPGREAVRCSTSHFPLHCNYHASYRAGGLATRYLFRYITDSILGDAATRRYRFEKRNTTVVPARSDSSKSPRTTRAGNNIRSFARRFVPPSPRRCKQTRGAFASASRYAFLDLLDRQGNLLLASRPRPRSDLELQNRAFIGKWIPAEKCCYYG